MKKNSTLVFSTDSGRVKQTPEAKTTVPTDGIIRIFRETKGRKGAGVSIVKGFDPNTSDIKAIAKRLKQVCGSGGTIKDGAIEIQGDHRDAIKTQLEKDGHTVKLAGG